MRVLRHARVPPSVRVRGLVLAGVVALGVWLAPTPEPPAAPLGGESVGAAQPLDGGGAAPRPAGSSRTAVRLPPDGPPAPTPLPVEALEGYVWPLPKGRLTLPFDHSSWGSRIVDGRPFHDGIDLATFCGDRIVAAHAGRVLAAGRRFDDWMGWRGDLRPYYARLDAKGLWSTLPIVVVIDDGNGYRSVYAHFREVVVRRGDVVEAGQLIGYEGDTGRASGCHLHYGLFSPLETATFRIRAEVAKRMLLPRYQTARVNPLDVLPPRETPRPRSSDPGGDTAER